MTAKNIINSFKTMGVFPLDRNAVHMPIVKSSPVINLAKDCGIAYIPLYSTATKRSYSSVSQLSTQSSTSDG